MKKDEPDQDDLFALPEISKITRDEDGRLVYVERGRSGRRYRRPMRSKSSSSKLRALAKAQRPWRP